MSARDRIINKDAFFDEKGEPNDAKKELFYQGRRIIGRDTAINGGVYLGGGEREALVVDDKKDPQLVEVYQLLLKTVKDNPQEKALGEVFDLVGKVLPYSKKIVEEVNNKYNVQKDGKIALGNYIEAKGGVCRHQALLAGYLLQKLKEEGYLLGTASVDRNYVPGEGAHAWVRYKNRAGEVMILDVAQNFLGHLSEINKGINWFYKRPEDEK